MTVSKSGDIPRRTVSICPFLVIVALRINKDVEAVWEKISQFPPSIRPNLQICGAPLNLDTPPLYYDQGVMIFLFRGHANLIRKSYCIDEIFQSKNR